MFLNNIKPAAGSKPVKRRVGRGIGCTLGKTCGKGHKGQKARAGGYHKVGFEGGQMPLQRRLPKIGFTSRKKMNSFEVRLSELKKVEGQVITVQALKSANLVSFKARQVTIIDSGTIGVPVNIIGVRVTKGARTKIEAVGGKVEV